VDPKLAMLIVLFGMIIALSHLDISQIERLRDRIALFRLRKTVQAADEAQASQLCQWKYHAVTQNFLRFRARPSFRVVEHQAGQ